MIDDHLAFRYWLKDVPVLLIVFGAAILVFALFGCSKSEARERHHRHHVHRVAYDANGNETVIGGRPAGCPYAYCGCAASIRVFGRIIKELNLAANWFRFPHASPAPGMVAVRYGHVFVIEAVNGDGTVVAYDGNSGGHLTRRHTVSLRGYSVRDPHGGRMARL